MQNPYHCPYWPIHTHQIDEYEYDVAESKQRCTLVTLLCVVGVWNKWLCDDVDVADVDILTYIPVTRKQIRTHGYEKAIIEDGTLLLFDAVAQINETTCNIAKTIQIKSPTGAALIDWCNDIILDNSGHAYIYMLNLDSESAARYKIREELFGASECGWQKISQLWTHLLLLSCDGSLYALGSNRYGECGFRKPLRVNFPTRVDLSRVGDDSTVRKSSLKHGADTCKVRDISTGMHFSAIVLTDGRVATCGSGYHGQTGHGDHKCRRHFVALPNIYNAVAIATGNNHVVVLLRNGNVLTWGTDIIVEPYYEKGTEIGRVCSDKISRMIPHYIDLPMRAIEVAAGQCTTMVLLANGNVALFGNFGSFGNMCHTILPVNAVAISCAIRSGMIMCINGSIQCVGCELIWSQTLPPSYRIYNITI